VPTRHAKTHPSPVQVAGLPLGFLALASQVVLRVPGFSRQPLRCRAGGVAGAVAGLVRDAGVAGLPVILARSVDLPQIHRAEVS
jgi:hypothetical protein